MRFAVEAAHTRRERRRRVDRVRRRPHKQRCVPVAAAGRNGTARVATGSVCRVASLCARHVCTAVGLPLCRHPLHQRARQGLPRGSAQLGVASTLLLHRTSAITSQCRESKTTTSGTHGCLGSKAGDESRTECLATQLRRSPGVWQLHCNSHNGLVLHAGRGLPLCSLHRPSIISRRCESPTKVTARLRRSGTLLQAAPGCHVGPLAPPVRHAPTPRISPIVHTRARARRGYAASCFIQAVAVLTRNPGHVARPVTRNLLHVQGVNCN